ncbi:zinc knuckle CX2CX4HX4C containing protein [Tanacetum coccineum]
MPYWSFTEYVCISMKTDTPLDCETLICCPIKVYTSKSNCGLRRISSQGAVAGLQQDTTVGVRTNLNSGYVDSTIDEGFPQSPLVSPTTPLPLRQSNADVAVTFGVPFTIVGDLEVLIKDIDAGKYEELLSGMTIDKHILVMDAFGALLADPVFDGVNISIPRKVVKKVSTHFEHTLYCYFIGKRMAFLVVEYYARNNWAKHKLKRTMMNNKGFFFFKFDSRAGLEAILEGGPWLILFEEDGICLIAIFICKPIMFDSYTSSMCNDSWGSSSFARCLIKVNSEADLVDVVTVGVPSLSGEGFTKETIRVEYE